MTVSPLGRTDAHPRRILVIFNPAAGHAKRARLDVIVDGARARGAQITVVETKAPGHGTELARTAGDFDVIAAAGGDGTVNEIINGLAGKSVALAVIPLGTANVLADEIGLGRADAAIAKALASGPLRPIRLGRANGRRFVQMAGAGFDANVVAAVSLALKKKLGPLAYVWAAAVVGFTGKLPISDVTIDGVKYKSASAVACNGRRYGGPFVAAPHASLADNSFQVVLMKGRTPFSFFRYGLGLMLGLVGKWWDVEIVTGREVVIEGVAGQPVQADGDIVTALPVRLEVEPAALMMVFPG
ncbi:MAG: diacylglycerol kinase family lipid kinase [Rhodospirillaceae bacterium]|nr:diacylglycerol kinase family lipid kinase [Rhodospirillaceae bacterium]